jgi:metal-responsive CopG/Arc/MetJ family transcriptional regulator
MKTAISLRDDLLERADNAASKMGVSRSRLVALAIENYLRQQQNEELLNQLNQTYKDPPDVEERRTVARMKKKFRSVVRDR